MGILNDLIAGNIIGITSIEYAIIMIILQNTSKYFNKSFLAIWLRASALVLLTSGIGILSYHHIYSLWIMDIKMLFNNLVTIFAYPAAHVILSKLLKVESKVVDAG